MVVFLFLPLKMCWNTYCTVVLEHQPKFAQIWAQKKGWLFTFRKTQAIKKTFCWNPELHQKLVFFCQITKWISTITMTGEEIPEHLEREWSGRRRSNQMVAFLSILKGDAVTVRYWSLKGSALDATDPFSLEPCEAVTVDSWHAPLRALVT